MGLQLSLIHILIETVPIIVIKKDKSRESFDRNKLLNGLLRACEKRPVSIDTLERLVAVSYTHLDVYKRQSHRRPMFQMI